MTKPVLFVSFRPLERAENLHSIYSAYKGKKVHMHSYDVNFRAEVLSGKYDLMVTDDFPSVSPGKCIVIWHGIQGGKYIGLDQPRHPYYDESTANKITYIISASTGMVNIWNRCTGVPKDRILPLGMPRTDQYTAYKPAHNGNRVYLFVPTFRDRGETPFPDIDWKYIDEQLTDNEMFIVKAHPWQSDTGREQVANNIINGMYKHIAVLSPASETTSWLYLSDVVITDYSSIMFDAYLLNKPVVLFEKNPGYTDTRGMYFIYPYQYCSHYATSEHDLLDHVRFRAEYPYLSVSERIIKSIATDMCDGHACERLCKLIDDINK